MVVLCTRSESFEPSEVVKSRCKQGQGALRSPVVQISQADRLSEFRRRAHLLVSSKTQLLLGDLFVLVFVGLLNLTWLCLSCAQGPIIVFMGLVGQL